MNAFLTRFRSLFSPNPVRDWAIALLLMTIILFGTACYGIYLYVAFESGSLFESASNTTPTVTTSAEDIQNILRLYQARQAAYVGHTVVVPALVDPAK